jgi:hypothetical protein
MLLLIVVAIVVPLVALYRRGPDRGRRRTVLMSGLSIALVVAVAALTNLVAVSHGNPLTNFSTGPQTVVYHLTKTDGRYLRHRDASGGEPEAMVFSATSPWTGSVTEVVAESIEVAGSNDPDKQGVVTQTIYRWYSPLLYPLVLDEKSDYYALVSVEESDELNSRP